MKKIFSAIDIGSNSIKIVVCEYFQNRLSVLAHTMKNSSGIEKGIIVDYDKAKESLKNAIDEINDSLGIKMDKAIINVPMIDSEYMINKGQTTITNNDKIVTGNDMVNALQGSIYNKIPNSRELVTIQPIKYNVDDEKKDLYNPRGIRADKLYVNSMSMTIPKKNIYKIVSILEELDVEVIDILFGIIGDYYEFKNKIIEEEVCGVINIGADKIETAVFNNGIIFNSNTIMTGSKQLDNEISYIYNITPKISKRIKETFALAHKEFSSTNDIYEVSNKLGIKVKINQYEISDVVNSKLKEMIEIAKKDLNDLTKKEISYIIVSGGIVNMPGFDILCKEVLGEKVIVNKVNIVGIRDNSYSQVVGMIRYFIDKLSIRGKEYTMFDDDKYLDLIENRKNNINNDNTSVFGRLFGYLFDNKED